MSWSYELPPAGAPDVGLEQYHVAGPGADEWKAAALLERNDELYVAAAPSGIALTRRLVAIPWSAVDHVSHDELTIHIRGLDDAVELDPAKAVENAPADARRVTELPPELTDSQAAGDVAGPRDRLRLFAALGAAALGFVTLMGVVALITESSSRWMVALLVVPAAILVLALVLSIRGLEASLRACLALSGGQTAHGPTLTGDSDEHSMSATESQRRVSDVMTADEAVGEVVEDISR